MIVLFSFTFDTVTQGGSMVGNVPAQQALQILQGLIIADAVNKAKEQKEIPIEKEVGDG